MVSPKRILGDNSPLLGKPKYEVQRKTSFNDECSLEEALEAMK